MHPKLLFVRRCEQAALLAASHDELDFLDLARILRQLLLDKHSLADTANSYGIRLEFRVVTLKPIWETLSFVKREEMIFYSMEDGIDPEIYPVGSTAEVSSVTLPQFLQHIVCYTAKDDISVKDAIKFAANAAGGVHHSPNPKPEFATQAALANQMIVGGLPFGIRQLRSIGRVALRGLDPLIAAVRAEQGSASEPS